MERRSRPLFTPLELVRFWLRDYGLALSAVAGLSALVAGLLVWLWSATRGPDRFEEAKVVRFGYYDGEWRQRPVVIVRTSDGAVRQLNVSRQKLRHCRAGDSIMLIRRGSGLFVHRQGCRAAADPL
ncbi:MAG: hypothetical protein ACXW27_03065 [Allosphingosinicella sp.]